MDCISWLFDGLGTSIIIFILGLAIGGGTGYCIGKNKNVQKQNAGNNSNQSQIGNIINNNGTK